jgi:hypothetical protein
MPPGKSNKSRAYPALAVIIVLVAGIAVYLGFYKKPPPTPPDGPVAVENTRPVLKPSPVIDYNELETDQEMKAMMAERKAEFGMDKGIDIIAKPDETIKVGESTVSMREILDKIRLKEGEIVEGTLNEDGTDERSYSGTYGIYIVQQTDNIWNIHFKFLQDYFRHKGISLSPRSDEPNFKGFSSGVGKVLKFSENMVHIYNLEEKTLDMDLNRIYPLNKVIVYNMDRVFALLDRIDYDNVNRIQFDGETLWIPAEQ